MKYFDSQALRLFCAIFVALFLPAIPSADAADETTYTVRQNYLVTNVPPSAKQVRGWFWMPEDGPDQRVQDFRILSAPDSVRMTRDPRYGRSWIYAEGSPGKPLAVDTEFTVTRRRLGGLAQANKTEPLTDQHRRIFTAELRRDEKHMEVNPKLQKIADDLAGDEKNPVLQARRFFDYVIEKSEHYSKAWTMPKGKCLGDAMECLAGAGDCCTDQHALFIALCRARGIPCRLIYGSRLKMENEGKEYDPGYRCWVKFFAPGLGWVPLDISSADTAGDRATDWFGGLDNNRLEWAEGRDFDLEPRSQVRPDLVIRAWIEVDGKPHPGLSRTLKFQRQAQTVAEASKPAVAKTSN